MSSIFMTRPIVQAMISQGKNSFRLVLGLNDLRSLFTHFKCHALQVMHSLQRTIRDRRPAATCCDSTLAWKRQLSLCNHTLVLIIKMKCLLPHQESSIRLHAVKALGHLTRSITHPTPPLPYPRVNKSISVTQDTSLFTYACVL